MLMVRLGKVVPQQVECAIESRQWGIEQGGLPQTVGDRRRLAPQFSGVDPCEAVIDEARRNVGRRIPDQYHLAAVVQRQRVDGRGYRAWRARRIPSPRGPEFAVDQREINAWWKGVCRNSAAFQSTLAGRTGYQRGRSTASSCGSRKQYSRGILTCLVTSYAGSYSGKTGPSDRHILGESDKVCS